jgi:hypothetical protein
MSDIFFGGNIRPNRYHFAATLLNFTGSYLAPIFIPISNDDFRPLFGE